MMRLGGWKAAALFVAALQGSLLCAQWSFTLDTTFRTNLIHSNVNSMAFLSTGELLLSGIMRFNGELNDRYLAKVDNNGQQVLSFGYGYGSGRLTPWEDKFYVRNGSLILRLLENGVLDLSYLPMSGGAGSAPYVQAQTTGDYHVYPDGRVLVSGRHTLRDSIRGFEGQYNLIWFSNTGYLDTTRTHRQANGVIWEFKELPDGKFICTCSCSQYEGQPVSRVFRIHADGELDTTFHSAITMGNIYEVEPLADGSVLLGGNFRFSGAPLDTVRLARLQPDGSRDASFASLAFAGNGAWWSPSGTIVFDIFPFFGGNHIIAGQFTSVNGQERRGLCMVDDAGNLMNAFDECGVGPFTHQGSTNAGLSNVFWNQDSTAIYLCGAYAGYTDGTTTDPGQRFVSRLLVSELSVSTPEPAAQPSATFAVYPNPSRDQVVLRYDFGAQATQLRAELRDAVGRIVASIPLDGARGQKVFDTTPFAPGTYLVQYLGANGLAGTVPLVIQR